MIPGKVNFTGMIFVNVVLVVTLLYILKVNFELHLVFLFLSCLFSVLFSCVDNA